MIKLVDAKQILNTRAKQEIALEYIKRREAELNCGEWLDLYNGVVAYSVTIGGGDTAPDLDDSSLTRGTASAIHAWLDRFNG